MPVETREIEALKKVVASGFQSEPWKLLTIGEMIRVEEGPLAGVAGILISVRSQHRLVISIMLMRRSTNKFLAKLASDSRKPDGLFVVQPDDIDAFLLPLPVGRLPGVGKVTGEKLAKRGIQMVADLRRIELPSLEADFGSYGIRLYDLSRGGDRSEVVPDKPTKSISVEDTFEQDIPLVETEMMIRCLAEKLWSASRKESRIGRTVVLKLKTSEFKILTRSHTSSSPSSSCEELPAIALMLCERVYLGPKQRFRLVGVGLSNFCEPEDATAQSVLFR